MEEIASLYKLVYKEAFVVFHIFWKEKFHSLLRTLYGYVLCSGIKEKGSKNPEVGLFEV